MRIAIVGHGRLGQVLARTLAVRHPVVCPGRDPIPLDVDVVWLAVPDAALAEVARRLPPHAVALHSAGTFDHHILRPHRPAVRLHPMMTFARGAPAPSGVVPAGLMGDPEAVGVARSLAADLGWTPFDIPGDVRLVHAAAVLAGNGAAQLTVDAMTLLRAAGVDADVLGPLVRASVAAVLKDGPDARTGPARRGDAGTLARARTALIEADLPAILPLFDALAARGRVN